MYYFKFYFSYFFLFLSIISYSQKENCIKEFFKSNDLLYVYSTYEINKEIVFDTLAIKKNQIEEIVNLFSENEIVNSIKNFKNDTTFLNFSQLYDRTDTSDGRSYSDYLIYKYDLKSYMKYNNFKNSIDKEVIKLLEKYNIINVSMFFCDERSGSEYYIYEKGYKYDGIFEFKFNPVNNPVRYSVLKHYYKEIDLSTYKDNLIGVQLNSKTQTIIIPIVKNGIYICDIKLIYCNIP